MSSSPTSGILILAALLAGPVSAADDMVAARAVNLREGPSVATPVIRALDRGTPVTVLERRPTKGFLRVTTAGQEGWVWMQHIERPAAAPGAAEAATAPPRAPADEDISFEAAPPCHLSIDECPKSGCAQPGSNHGRSNRLKRTLPDESTPAIHLDFATLRQLQTATDARGVPQGVVLSRTQRDKLKNLTAGPLTVSEGDYIQVAGFIASDRDIFCGSRESVNCRLGDGSFPNLTGPCFNTDIHIPIVEQADHDEDDSVVVEPIPFLMKDAWTPEAFNTLHTAGTKLLVRGQLYYDSQHSVGHSPRRFTLWEVHPVTHIFKCEQVGNDCDPSVPGQWTELQN